MCRRSVVAVSIVTCLSCCLEASGPEKLSVYVTDRAAIPPVLILSAQTRAARLLAAAGVQSSWKLCPASSMLPGRLACSHAGPLDVSVRILPSAEAKMWPVEPESCGMALAGALGEHGFLAIVDAGCIGRLAGSTSEAWVAALGHVIAHEVGHLLLGRDSHSSSGLMRARWTAAERNLLVRGGLHFSPEDSARLQEAVSARRLSALATAR